MVGDEEQTDVQFTYSFEDETIAKYENGNVVGLKIGETEMTVSTTFEGRDFFTSCTVKVKDDVVIGFENTDTVTVYTTNTMQGFNNVATLTQVVYLKGVEQTITSDIKAATTWEIVETTSENLFTVVDGVVTANLEGIEGSAKVRYTYTHNGRAYTSNFVNVSVEIPVIDKTNDISLEKVLDNGKLTITTDDLDANYTITSIKMLVNDQWTDINEGDLYLPRGEQVVRVYNNQKYGVAINVCLIDKILYTAADLDEMIAMMRASRTDETTMSICEGNWNGNTHPLYKYHGYFVLGANIDYEGAQFQGLEAIPTQSFGANSDASYYHPDYGFTGTFDGRGYTISNFSFNHTYNENGYTQSIFGQLSSTAVVKNVQFKNVEVGGFFGSVIALVNAGTIENVSVTGVIDTHWSDGTWSCGYKGILVGSQQGGTIRNVVVSIKKLNPVTIEGCGYGLLVGSFGGEGQTRVGTIENAFVVFEAEQSVTLNADLGNWFSVYTYAVPNTLKELETTNNIKVFTYGETFTGNTESFVNQYWTVAEGEVPVFNGIKEPEYAWNVTVIMKEGASETDITSEVLGANANGTAVLDTVIDITEVVETMLQLPQYEGCDLIADESTLVGTVTQDGLALKVVVRKINHVKLQGKTEVDMSISNLTIALPAGHTVTSGATVRVAGQKVVFTVTGNTLKIANTALKTVKASGEQIVEITNEANTICYEAEVLLITKILYTAADLETMVNMIYASGVTDGTTMSVPEGDWGTGTYNRYKFYGYFVLGSNIEYSNGTDNIFKGVGAFAPQSFGANSDASYYNPNYGFTGTFDGRGYTISNLRFEHNYKDGYGYTGSIFGQLSSTAVIKNVRFDNATVAGQMGSIVALVSAGTIENVSVTSVTTNYWADEWTTTYKGILVGTQQGGTIRNVVVSIKSLNVASYEGNGYGLLVGAFGGEGQARVGTIENVFVVFEANQEAVLSSDHNNWFTVNLVNYKGAIPTTLNGLESTNNINVFTYGETFTGNTESFENEYWTVTESQVPVFKAK